MRCLGMSSGMQGPDVFVMILWWISKISLSVYAEFRLLISKLIEASTFNQLFIPSTGLFQQFPL